MISSEEVTEIFKDCLYRDEELIDGKPLIEPIIIQGIRSMYGLHPERIKYYSSKIEEFMNVMPNEFKQGWSFLNLCKTKDGDLWTGLHSVCEELMVLAIASGKMVYCCEKDMWDVLPGKVPYVKII